MLPVWLTLSSDTFRDREETTTGMTCLQRTERVNQIREEKKHTEDLYNKKREIKNEKETYTQLREK